MVVSGKVLKRLREGMGWSQTEAAAKYKVSRPYLARLESSNPEQTRQPSPKVAKRIAEAHGLGLSDILTGAEEPAS